MVDILEIKNYSIDIQFLVIKKKGGEATLKMYERIRCYIESNGLKLNFVAEKAGINAKRFYRLINGNAPLSVEEYETICRGLAVEPGYFFKDKFLDFKNKQTKEVS